VRGIANRARLADARDLLADRTRIGGEAVGEDERHQERDQQTAGEVADEHQAPVAQHAADGDAGALVDQREWAEHEHARQQVEAHQVEHAEADREQHRAEQRRAAVDRHRDREHGGESEQRAGHERADQRVPRGHEDLRFTSINHLGDELGRREVSHERRTFLRARRGVDGLWIWAAKYLCKI
jgi:hypothetical protein